MKPPPDKLLPLLTAAAELKAAGASWAAVAAGVSRSPDTVRRWPALYPAAWRRLVREAERQLLTDARAESVSTLRQMLRSEAEKTRPDAARILWELGRDPSLRVKVVCSSEALAAERGRFLRDAVAGNARLRLAFPHLTPAKPWEATRFSVKRPADLIGPSVAALGVGAASTGTRADLLVCDDVVDVKALYSRADRDRVKTFFRENLMNLLEPDGRFWNLSTPWHLDDLNSELKRN